jgi:hypothetical protein
MRRVNPLGRTFVVILCSKLFTSCAQAAWLIKVAATSVNATRQKRKKIVILAPGCGARIRPPHTFQAIALNPPRQTAFVTLTCLNAETAGCVSFTRR